MLLFLRCLQEQAAFEKDYEERRLSMQEEINRLGNEITKRKMAAEKLEADIVEQWRDLQSKREKVLRKLF